MERWEKALMCNTCSFPWCKYSHHGWFQDTHMISQNMVIGFPKVIAAAVRADGAALHTADGMRFQNFLSDPVLILTLLLWGKKGRYYSHFYRWQLFWVHTGGWLNSMFILGMYVTDHTCSSNEISQHFYTTLKNPRPWRNREGSRKWREENVWGKLWLTALHKRCGAGSIASFTSGYKRRTSLRPALGNSCGGYSCCSHGNRLLLLFSHKVMSDSLWPHGL